MAEKDSLFVDKIYNTLQAKGVKSIGSYDEFVSKMKDNPDLFRDKVFNTLQAKGIKSTSNYDDFIANVNSVFEQKDLDYTDLALNPDSVKSITQEIDSIKFNSTTTANPLDTLNKTGKNVGISSSVEQAIAKPNAQAQAKQIWENIGTSDAYSIENIKATVDNETWNALVSLASEEKANHDNAIRNEVATRYYGTSAPETREREIQTQKALAQNPYEKEKFVAELQSQHSGRYVPAVTKEVENVKNRLNDLGYKQEVTTNNYGNWGEFYFVDKNGVRISPKQAQYYTNASKLIKDTEEVLNAPSRFDDSKGAVNFGKGIAERATDEEFWMPMLTVAKNMNIGAVAKKMNEGKELTPEESILLESYINYGLAQQARQYDMSKGYMAGQGTAESVMFMLEMAIGGAVSKATGKVLSSAGKKFANKFANNVAGKAVGKATNTLTKFATSGNNVAKVGKTLAGAVIDPAFMASNYKNISQQYADEHVFGDRKFGVIDATSAWLDTSKEILTEKAGEGLSFIGAKGWNKIKATKYGKWIDSPMMKQLRNLYKGNGSMNLFMGMMQNPLSEIGEEYIGGIMDFVRSYNPLLDDDRKKELREGATSMFTAEGLGDTALMVAPLSFIFGGVSFVKGANATRNFSKAKDKLTEELFRQGLNEEQVAQIILKLDSTDDIEERKKIFAQLSDAIIQQWGDRNPSTTQEEKQLFENKIHSTLEYYLMSSQAFNDMVAKITDNYNGLKEDERKSVDKAFEAYTEEFFKRKQEEAKARNEERKATEMAEEQVAEQLFEETVQEAEEVVPNEDAPQTEIYDEKKGYYITKEGDNISITSQDGQLLKLSNKSEANSIVKNLNENFEGEVEFEVIKDSSGVTPKFSIVSKPKTQEVVTTEVTEENVENSEGKVTESVEDNKEIATESVENVEKMQGEDVETDGNSKEIERNKEEIEEEKAEEIAEQMLQEAITETNEVTGTEDVKQPTIVYYRGKQHELLSPTTEDGSIIVEDNLVRIKEVGKDRTKAVRPENVYNDANYSEVAKTYPPKTNTEKKRKVNPQDYKNTDVNANDVADAFLREYGVEDTIVALQEMYSEALEKTQSAKGLAKADAKKELRRLEAVANAISEKTNVVVNLQNNTVEEIVEETEEVAEEPKIDVSEVVTDSDPVEVTESETAEEVPTNEDSTNKTPTTEETGVVEQEPIIETELTEQTTTSVEEKDAIKDPDEVKETPVKIKKEKTKKNPRGAGRKSNEQKRQEALENTEGKDLSSNVNNTIEENSGLGMVDFLMTEIGNMPDVVKNIAEPMLDDFDENTSYEQAYKLFTDVENELIKQGVNATKFHDLAEMYIYRPCEVTDEAIKEKYPLLEQTQTQQEENTKVIEEEDVEDVEEVPVAYTQEYIDSIPLEEFTYYQRFYNRDKKNGVLEKSIAIIKPLDDRYYAAIFTIKGQKVRSIIDGNKVEMSPDEGIIVYPKGEDDKPNFNKPYLAMMNSEELDKGLTTRDTVNLKSLFDGEGDSKKSQFATTLFLSNGNRLVKTDSEIKEEKKNNAVKNFEKIEGSNETKFKTKVAQYLDIIEEGLRINENSHSDLLSKLNEFIGRINTLAEGVGFIKIKPLKTGSSRAELESYIKAIRNFIENPTGNVSTIVNDIVSRHNLSNITESEEFSDVVKNQASLSPALKKKVKAEVSELKEQEKDIVAQIAEKNKKGSLSAVERIELKKLKDKKAEISKERKEKEASLEGNFNKVIDYVNEQINRVNAEFKLFGITPIKKIESTKANPIKDIKELKGVLDEALSAERKVEATTKEYDSKEEAIKQLMKEYEVDEATANDIYNLREKNGTLEVRKAIPSAIADVYANEYWYSGARKRFEQSLDVLFAGGVRVVSQEAIDKILNLNKPIAVTQKNVDILKQWIGGVDIEVVKPNHKDRALYDGAFGWYDLANKRVVVVEGAPISVVLHEIGWHATLDWAKTNDTKMYEKMLQIASEAPADIRFDIVSKYGELSEEAFLDELGAEMFTRAAQKKLYEYITTKETRRWWQKMFDAFDKLFNKARLKIFRQQIKSKKIDFEAMEKMSSVDFLNSLADTMIRGEVLGKWSAQQVIDGKVLGEFDDYEIESSNEPAVDAISEEIVDKFTGIKYDGVDVSSDEAFKSLLSRANSEVKYGKYYRNNLDYFYDYLEVLPNYVQSVSDEINDLRKKVEEENDVDRKNELNDWLKFYLSLSKTYNRDLDKLTKIDANKIEFIENKDFSKHNREGHIREMHSSEQSYTPKKAIKEKNYELVKEWAKNNESTTQGDASEARLPNDNIPSVPTSSAKLQQNIEITNNLNKIISDINNGRSIGIHELLFEISKSFGVNVNSLEKSKYIKLPNGLHLRISDHYSNTMYFNYYKHNTDNYGLVIKQSNANFRSNDNVDYWEFAYFPDLLDKERQIEIIRGLIEFVNNGNFSALPAPDKMNGSGKYKEVSDKYNQDNKKDTNIRQMRAYHGSGADFDRFDHSFMGTGEGLQAYGWGTYVTEVEGIAKAYAKSSSQPYYVDDYDMYSDVIYDGDIDEELKFLIVSDANTIAFEEQRETSSEEIIDYIIRRFERKLDRYHKEIDYYEFLKESLETDLPNVEYGSELYDKYKKDISHAESIILEYKNELSSGRILVEKFYNLDPTKITLVKNNDVYHPKKHLYTVEIPDDNRSNYLDYTRKVPHKELDRIKEELLNEGPSVQHRIIDLSDNSSDYDFNYKSALDELIENGFTGKDLYAELEEILGSDRKVSEFLHRIGYVGIKYPAEYQSGGRSDNAKNYVIFDANDIQIKDHIRYMSSGSNIYGVQQGDELFVNITPEQKIGDCADLWLEQLRQSNPRAYELVFGEGENPNLMSDLMAIVRDKLKGLVDAEEIDLSDEVLREMTFEEFMTFADALENLNMQNVSKSITRVQESVEKFEAMLSAESPTSKKAKEALERWWTAAMDDGLPITRMLQGLNAYLVQRGLPKLDSRYDIANLRNLAPSKSKFFIEKFRDRGEFADFVKKAKALDAIIVNNEALKDLADKLALDRVNSDKEALHSLVEVYMLAKDNIERRNMDLPCTSNDAWLEKTGMADVEFVEIFEAEFTTKQLADFWRAKNKATNVSLDFLLDYGILSQAQYDKFKERQYYVPQRGFDNLELEEDNNIPSNTSVPNPKSVQALYKAGGRETMATSPIAQILLITDNAVRTSLNNEYRKAMLDLVRKYPAYFIDVEISNAWQEIVYDENGEIKSNIVAVRDEKLMEEDKEIQRNISAIKEEKRKIEKQIKEEEKKETPDTSLIDSLKKDINKLDGEIKKAEGKIHYHRIKSDNQEITEEHQVLVKDKGGDIILTFNDKRIANALNNLHFDQAGAVRFIKKMNRYTSNIYTTYNPAFGFKNLARDIMQIILNGFSQYGWKFLGHASKNVLTCLPKGFFNIASYLNKSNIKFDEDFEEFLSSGAMTGYVYSMSLEDYRNNVKSILQGDYYEGGELTKKGWEKMKDTLKFITEFSELYVRYVAFRTCRDLGYSKHQSAVTAKNLGVNFDKRGSGFGKGSGYKAGKPTGNDNSVIWQLIDVVNNNMSFSRASMRGMASLYEPLFLGDKKTRKNTRWMLGGIAIFGVFEGLLYAFSGDDDEDKDRLIREKVGAWDRHSNTMWWVDDTTWYGKIGKNFGSITQNFIPFYTFGFELARMIDNMYFNKAYKMSLDNAALNFGYHVYSEMINYALPIPPTITESIKTGIEAIVTLDWKNDYKKIRQFAPIVVPTFAKPIAELGFNVDYLGNKIYYTLRKDKANSEYSNFNYSFLWEDEYGRHNKYILKDGDIKLQYNHEYNVIIANHLFDSYLPKPVVDAKEMLLDKFSEANGVVIEKPESKDAKYDSQVRKAAYRYARDVVKIMEDLTKDSKDAMNNRDVNIRYIANELKNLYGSEIVEIYIKAKEAVEFYEISDIDKYKRDYFAKNQRMVTDEEVRRHFNLSEEYLKHNQDRAVDNAKDVYMQLLEYQDNYDKLGWRVKNNVRVQ